MAYIRWGEELLSGNKSASYVFGSPNGLINMDKGDLIPYCTVREWFKTKTDSGVKEELRRRLELQDEELEVVCNRLFDERHNGEWDEPFEFELRR